MDYYKFDLINMTKTKVEGIAAGTLKSEYINLYELLKEINESRKIRNNLINKFIVDCNFDIHDLDYLRTVPFPLIIPTRELFDNELIKVKLFKRNYRYEDYLFSEDGLVSDNSDKDINEIVRKIMPYIKGIFRVVSEDSFLNNSFYDELVITLYSKYINKLIVDGYGIRLGNYNIDNKNKLELEKIYYENLKLILENINIVDSLELERYRSSKKKDKILEIYRG